jgi:hypothetical protein
MEKDLRFAYKYCNLDFLILSLKLANRIQAESAAVSGTCEHGHRRVLFDIGLENRSQSFDAAWDGAHRKNTSGSLGLSERACWKSRL